MTDDDGELDQDLLANAGRVLRRRREQHRLTQAKLAERTGTTQATVARIETGDRAPSIAMLGRLFAALGCQARITLEPLDHQTDQAIAALQELPIADRIAESGLPTLADELAPVPHVFRGAAAALLQGAPVPVAAIELALAWPDTDAFTRWLDRRYGKRWNRHDQDYGFVPLHPHHPGEHRWRIIGGIVIEAVLAEELPDSIEVRHDGRVYRVVPLSDIEIRDPDAARLLRRARAATAAAAAA